MTSAAPMLRACSAWRLFAIAATAALVFGTAGWVLALFGGRKKADAPEARLAYPLGAADLTAGADVIAARAASADEQLPRSTPTATGR